MGEAPIADGHDRRYKYLFSHPDFVERLLTSFVNEPFVRELEFSRNRAGHDEILGDAHEYRMRHFATESGKSKGHFYTPAGLARMVPLDQIADPRTTSTSTCRGTSTAASRRTSRTLTAVP